MHYLLSFVLVLSLTVCSYPAIAGDQSVLSPLQAAIKSFENDASLRNANWSFYVKDITTGETIYENNIYRPLVPASVQKLVTTASAMIILGHDYQYETLLQHDGTVDRRGVLRGNLYIKGGGDPSFGSSLFKDMPDSVDLDHVFKTWLNILQRIGISTIEGHIIADERIFDDELVPRRWLWEHIGNYFGAGVSGLTVNDNEYSVFFNAGSAVGSPATVAGIVPEVPGMSYVNQVTTGAAGSGDQVYIFGAPYSQERLLTGTVPLGASGFRVRGSLPDPPNFVAESFRKYIIENGIEVNGYSTSYRTKEKKEIFASENRINLHTHYSPFLFDIIYQTNINSLNHYAESLVKTISYHEHREGAFDKGLQKMTDLWISHGMDDNHFIIYDGSGLSPSNRITAEQLMTVLYIAAQQPAFSVFYNSLPLAGYSGSLENLFRGSASEGNLRAKSGFLNHVRSYAGYATMRNGNLAAFVLIANDYAGTPAAMRHKMVHLMNTITLHPGDPIP